MKSVVVFPGQGSQHRGMGVGLFEQYPTLVAEADAYLGYSIEELCLHDTRKVLNQTEFTQPALYVVNTLAYQDRLARGNPRPDFLAGHSLGEYCALFAAGAFDFITGLKLVHKRGSLMSRAPRGGMAAIVNLELPQVEAILAGLPFKNIDIANINSRQQCILSGIYDELMAQEVQETFSAAGGTFIPLNVSAAFHSRCMLGVQEEFAAYLSTVTLADLQIPVVANYSARPYPRSGYTDLLNLQIANSVKWYESVSWMIAQGANTFDEIGPGNVLTKLSEKILRDPLPLTASPLPSQNAAPTKAQPHPQLIFMYGGQGSQYYQMGRELYNENKVFQRTMDEFSDVYRAILGVSLVDAIYQKASIGETFDDILYTHAALYSVGYSLTEVLHSEGYAPDAVLGFSLGEFIAAAVAGAIDVKQGLNLVIRQAQLLKERCRGGMLSVLAAPALFGQRPDIFAGTTLAGINYAANFVVSGEDQLLLQVQARLEQEQYIAVRLPVRQGFHSELIDPIRQEYLTLARGLTVSQSRLPIYSSTYAKKLGNEWLENQESYLWDVARLETRFNELILNEFDPGTDNFFVDLSASGSLTNFLKYGHGDHFRCAAAINPFGKDKASMDQLLNKLRNRGQ